MNQAVKNRILGLLVLFSTVSYGQAPDWGWAKKAGGSQEDTAEQVLTDSQGNVYVWGRYMSSSIQFGTYTFSGPPAGTGADRAFLAKYNASGLVVWARKIPNITCVTIDKSDNVFVSGLFYEPLTLDGLSLPGHGVSSGQTYMAKYNAAGAIQWLQQKGYSFTLVNAMVQLDDNHLAVTGISMDDTIDGQTIENSTWIALMDIGTGQIATIKRLCAADYNVGLYDGVKIAADGQHNLYLYGNDQSYVPLNESVWQLDRPGLTYIAKFDSGLNFLWSKMHSGIYHDAISDTDIPGIIKVSAAVTDHSGNIYLLGNFRSDSLEFDSSHTHSFPAPFLTHTGYGDWIVKYAPDGNISWDKISQRTYYGNPELYSRTLCIDKLDNIYYGGTFKDDFSVDSFAMSPDYNTQHVFVSKIKPSGETVWLKKNTGSSESRCNFNSMAEDGKGSLYLTGRYVFTSIWFGANILTLTPPAQQYAADMFLAKLGNCTPAIPSISIATAVICNGGNVTLQAPAGAQYLWSDGTETQTVNVNQPGSYSVAVADSFGCYATSLPVTVTAATVDSGVTLNGQTLSANETGAAYQWLACNGTGGFDMIVGANTGLFTPEQSGSYAVEVSKYGCTLVSDCIQTVVLGVPTHGSLAAQLVPNPNDGQFTIRFDEALEGHLFLYDFAGRKIFSKKVSGTSVQVNDAMFEDGIYLVTIETSGRQYIEKMIVYK